MNDASPGVNLEGVATMTTRIQLAPEIEDRLERLAQATGRSKDCVVQEMIHLGKSSTSPLDAVSQDVGLASNSRVSLGDHGASQR
ncbi:ribbon-helix-helix domain-containing protein [Cyanobium sp. FGCU-52]|nr:ribbon-helix-helix domain-containing protein [Cyanobium sp. FGCU52]